MWTAYSSDQVRQAESALMATVPDGELMQRAASGLAAVCARLLPGVYGSRVVLLVGGGDNGGDALYAGARLAGRGARVEAVAVGSRIHAGGLAALRKAGGRLIEPGEVGTPDLILDGLLGIGGKGALRESYATLARIAARSGAMVVAVDVPSGVDAGTGEVAGEAVRAQVTVTFGARKAGLLVDPGAERAGVVEFVDIGLADHLPEPEMTALTSHDVAGMLPVPGIESDKYRRGVVGVLAGSDRFAGAAVLAVGGAVRSGAGMVRFAGPQDAVHQVRARWPEAITTVLEGDPVDEVGRVQAWVLGPGMGTDDRAARIVAEVLGTGLPVIVDADALTVVSKNPELLHRQAPTLITPHAGELGRLLGVDAKDIEARRLEHVRRAVEELQVTVLLKGSTTLVAERGRPVRANTTGTSWLATAGTGDVLSGISGTLLAAGLPPYDAGSVAAFLHGLAARKAAEGAPIAALDVALSLPDVIRHLRTAANMEA
ncbi:bifunctional ADP-dependent NAD(P)H-hydrate dehydratase/NAD(P)H-hydrate epimerase [Herbidospora cretacea]|uniref:bifunctional ADP-dependent NAD(P)H-hydrate dehydratase/NAD(P)H-hydrate epimerase n=1 Tax=Herbidospora cretacea TaxID=28444 RepID=UPI000772F835|nr:bifunctional ADP-dependent NAD(P)H-hydrate dehydratase/NAD(P)H-hydrate epimerase [Herbidospora cretacea]